MIIYGDIRSGNCHKVKYTADKLGLSYDWRQIDVVKGETRKPDYLAINSMGQVPAVVFDDGRALAQSNAIIRYLARDSELLPRDPFTQAKVDEPREELEAWRVKRGDEALDLLDRELADRTWLVGEQMTIADIALLAYTRLADEGGFNLAPRRNVTEWISRCETELAIAPGH
jgi:glutathione S-transferase